MTEQVNAFFFLQETEMYIPQKGRKEQPHGVGKSIYNFEKMARKIQHKHVIHTKTGTSI